MAPFRVVPLLAIVCLLLSVMAGAVSMSITDALLPRLATEFSIPLGQAAQAVTAFALAYGVSQLLSGPLGDRFGKFRVIAWGCAASSITALMCAFASGQSGLLVGRLCAGAAAAGLGPPAWGRWRWRGSATWCPVHSASRCWRAC